MNDKLADIADKKESVAAIYEQGSIAKTYLDKRMQFSWQRLLHHKQVAVLNAIITQHHPARVLEVAPGPARLSTELSGIKEGIMVENSQEMVSIANERLRQRALSDVWQVKRGDAFALTESVQQGSADFVYTFRFLRHFRIEEREYLYRELSNCLAPGGLLAFDVVGAMALQRLETRNKERAEGEIAIYDVSYSEQEFRKEMESNGFGVVDMIPILRHFDLQSWISYKGDDVLPRMAGFLVKLLEAIPSREPLEWVAICRKR